MLLVMDEELRGRYRRDFTREPIRERPSARPTKPIVLPRTNGLEAKRAADIPPVHLEEFADANTPRRHRKLKTKRKNRWKVLALLVVLIILGAGGGLLFKRWHTKSNTSHHFPNNIVQGQSAMQLYYPVGLPTGYIVNNDFKSSPNLVTYSVRDKASNKFVLSIQPLPSTFNYDLFKQKLLNPDEFNTSTGSALVGSAGPSLIAIVRTNENVLVIINALNTGTKSQLEVVVRSLQKSN